MSSLWKFANTDTSTVQYCMKLKEDHLASTPIEFQGGLTVSVLRVMHIKHWLNVFIEYHGFGSGYNMLLCHGMTSFPLLCLPPSTSTCLCPCPSTSVHVHLPSATTPKCTCGVLAQLHHAYHQTNFRSRPNLSRPSSHAKGCHPHALFPIHPICLIPFHWQ